MNHLIASLALCFLSADSSPDEPRRALVIGNDAYAEPWRLDSCVNDAKAIQQWLETVGYQPGQVTLLTDARMRETLSAFEELTEVCQRDTHRQVFIYYSGHGTTLDDDDGDEGPGDATDEGLVTVDGKVLRDDTLFSFLSTIANRTDQLVIVFDSCFSGGGLKDLNRRPKFVRYEALQSPGGQPPVRPRESPKLRSPDASALDPLRLGAKGLSHQSLVFFSASNQFQPSYPGEPLSEFTAVFLEALGRKRNQLAASDGTIRLGVLHQHLTRALYDVPQTPLLVHRGVDLNVAFVPDFFPPPDQSRLEDRLTTVLEGLLALPSEKQADSWTVDVTPTQSGPLTVGTRFALKARASESGYLVAFTISPSGKVMFLFPNRYRPLNEIAAGQETLIPYRDGLVVQPPVGRERYFVYLLERNPFANFPFGEVGETMMVGQLEEVVDRFRAHGRQVSIAGLTDSLTRGFAVEPLSQEVHPATKSDYGRWSRAAVVVQSTDRP